MFLVVDKILSHLDHTLLFFTWQKCVLVGYGNISHAYTIQLSWAQLCTAWCIGHLHRPFYFASLIHSAYTSGSIIVFALWANSVPKFISNVTKALSIAAPKSHNNRFYTFLVRHFSWSTVFKCRCNLPCTKRRPVALSRLRAHLLL